MAILEKEQILLVVPENIPEELKILRQWVNWDVQWNEKRQQFDKVPYQVNGIDKASVTDATTWNTFEEVLNAHENGVGEGIGLVLTETDPYAVIDVDGLQSVDDLPELAQEIVNMSYAEQSPSGQGLHVWIRYKHDSTKFMNKNTKLGYELYDKKRFITVVGEAINNLRINESSEISSFIEKVFKREQSAIKQEFPQLINSDGRGKSHLSESKLIEIASKSKKGDIFKACLYGGWEQYYTDLNGRPDQSNAVMGFLNQLAFYSNCEYEMMNSIFQKSALMYDKWWRPQNGTTWGDEQLRKAIYECQNTFQIKEESQEEERNEWWKRNNNGTYTFVHHKLAKIILDKFSIIRFPNAHGNLWFWNRNKGIYEEDLTGRQVNYIIRKFDEDLKTGQIREVYNFIQDTSPIVNEVNEKYIALENGLLNFETFEIEPFTPKYFVTQKIPVAYDPNAYDEFVETTLEKVTDGYEPSRRNIEEMLGCVLYQGVLVPKIFFLYGASAHNGKSSVLNLIHATFNKNGNAVSAVTPQKLATNNFAASSLYGKAVNIVDDLPDTTIQDSGVLKSAVTGGWVEIERKGQNAQTVKMNTTFIIASNFLPSFSESGQAINRRLHIIEFAHNFSKDPDRKSDVETMQLTQSESARKYVLKLAIEALKRMLNNPKPDKLTHNPKSEMLAQKFVEHNDPLDGFWSEFDKEYFEKVPGKRALEDYDIWCHDNKMTMLPAKKFKDAVCQRYEMVWKDKRLKINGDWKTLKGFVSLEKIKK